MRSNLQDNDIILLTYATILITRSFKVVLALATYFDLEIN